MEGAENANPDPYRGYDESHSLVNKALKLKRNHDKKAKLGNDQSIVEHSINFDNVVGPGAAVGNAAAATGAQFPLDPVSKMIAEIGGSAGISQLKFYVTSKDSKGHGKQVRITFPETVVAGGYYTAKSDKWIDAFHGEFASLVRDAAIKAVVKYSKETPNFPPYMIAQMQQELAVEEIEKAMAYWSAMRDRVEKLIVGLAGYSDCLLRELARYRDILRDENNVGDEETAHFRRNFLNYVVTQEKNIAEKHGLEIRPWSYWQEQSKSA